MGAKSQRLFAFAKSQADAVTKALEAGDSQAALAAAAVTPWQPKLTSEQLAKIFDSEAGQEQLSQKMSVITKTPIEQARTQVLQILTGPGPIQTGTTVNTDGLGVKVKNPATGTEVTGPVQAGSGAGKVLGVLALLTLGGVIIKKLLNRRKSS